MFIKNIRQINRTTLILILLFKISIFLSLLALNHAEITHHQKTAKEFVLSEKISVHISAYVEGYFFDLQGLTSPWAKVDFYSTEGNIDVTTIANKEGVFHFQNVLAPIQTGDFCFISYDINGIANNPLCFPPPPPKTITIIKDIVLSPTLTFDQGLFRQGDLVEASGRTFPNAEIAIYMFEENRPPWIDLIDVLIPKTYARSEHSGLLGWWPQGLLRGVRPAFARSGPRLTITADTKGDFSYNLPTQKSSLWRMFAGPKYKNENMVAKSNILEFSALSWWQWILFQLFQYCYKIYTAIYQFITNWIIVFGLLILAILVIWKKILNSTLTEC